MRKIVSWLGLGLLLLVTGCGEGDRLDIYERSLSISRPVVLQEHVAFLNRNFEEVVLLKADGDTICVEHIPTGREPIAIEHTPDLERLAVLSRKDKSLTLIDLAEDGSERTYPLTSAFDAVTFSPDSRYAIVYYDPFGDRPEEELFNPNEYAIIDLDLTDNLADAVLPRVLRGLGGDLREVHYVPPFELDDSGEAQRYAMFLFDSYITFADLQDSSFEVTVYLTLDQLEASIIPQEVLFNENPDEPNLQDAYVYILAANTNDPYAIKLLPGATEDGKVRLAPNIEQLQAGTNPEDIVTYQSADGSQRLMTVNQGSVDISIIDPDTTAVTTIELDAAGDSIHLFEALNPNTDALEPHALIYGSDGLSSVVSFVRLWEVEDRLGQAVEALSLNKPIETLYESPIQNQLVFSHTGGDGVTLLDLDQRAYTPLEAQVVLSDVEVDDVGRRLYAALSGSERLNLIDLSLGTPSSVPLDFPISSIVLLPQAQSLLAFHSRNGGMLTAMKLAAPAEEGLAAPAPSRDEARIYTGFFFDDLLEQE